jgi:hypothetical protein
MMIIFHFTLSNFGNPILEVKSNKFFKNVSTCTRCVILQNGLHVNKILIFWKIQVSGALKNTYVLSNYAWYNHKIFFKNMK